MNHFRMMIQGVRTSLHRHWMFHFYHQQHSAGDGQTKLGGESLAVLFFSSPFTID